MINYKPVYRWLSSPCYLIACLIAAVAPNVNAQTNLYWDPNGSTNGIGGAGTWATNTALWTTNPSGSETPISGNWTGLNFSNTNANNAILAGPSGVVTIASSIFANDVTVESSDYTIRNSSSTSSRALRTRGGVILSNGVNLNLTAGPATNTAGLIVEGSITNAPGATGTSVTITGETTNADNSIRISLDGTSNDIGTPTSPVNVNVATTGNGYASIRNILGTSDIYGSVTVAADSRLMLGASSTLRRLNIRGNLTTTNTDLLIGGEPDLTGVVVLYGTNSIGGNVLVNAPLGYASTNAFGRSTLILGNGAVLGANSFGTSSADRTLPNSLSISGDIALGLRGQEGFSTGNDVFLGGNINLGGATRIFSVRNDTVISGVISNGGLTVTDTNGSTRRLTLSANNTFTGPTVISNGGILAIVGSVASSSSVTAESGGALGYGSAGAFGANTIVLKGGTRFGQIATIGTNDTERTIANNLSLQGDVTFGLGSFENFFAGNVNLNGSTRVVTLSNSTTVSGVISNGGLTVTDTNGSTRRLTLSGNNTFTGPTTISNGGTLAVIGSVASSSSVTAESGGALGYGSAGAFGANTIVLKGGTRFGQIATIGTNDTERTIANNLSLQGDVTFGFGTLANFFGGGVDLGGVSNRNIFLTNSTTISGVISNGGLVVNDTIDGTNDRRLTLTIASPSTFTGPTVVAGGSTNITVVSTNFVTNGSVVSTNLVTNTATVDFGPILLVTGSLASSNVTVQTNARLSGTGTISGGATIESGGELSPGNASAGPITVSGNVNLAAGSTATMEIGGLADYDRVASSTSSVLNGTVNVGFTNGFTPVAGTFQLFSGAVSGSPTLVVPPLNNTNLAWVTNNFATTGEISIASASPPATGYGAWLTNYPTLTGGNTNGTADPDSDGFNNNLEYAFDGNPTVGTPALLTAAVSGSNFFGTFLASTNGAAVSYSVESTTDLSAGIWTNNGAATLAISNSSNQANIPLSPAYLRREFSAPATNAAGKIFYRVKALISN